MIEKPSGVCIVCGRSSERVVWRENGYEGRACDCGTVFVSPQPPDEFAREDEMHGAEFYSLPAAAKVAWIRARVSPVTHSRLLEVGPVDGAFLEAARANGYSVAAIEASQRRAHAIRSRLGVSVAHGLIESAPLERDRYDIVYHCDLMSHFPDPRAALRAMAARLAPGGVLAFEAGVLGAMSPTWYRMIGRVGFPTHRWLYSEASLHRLLAETGFVVRDQQRFGLAPYVVLSRATRRVRLESQERWENFLRYSVGAYAPAWGPLTLWLVVEPIGGRFPTS